MKYLTVVQSYWDYILYGMCAVAYLFGVSVGGKTGFSRWATFCKGLTCLLVSLTAPFVMLVGMWTVRKTSTNLPSALRWWDTPDEPDLVDLDVEATARLWNIWWRLAVYDWFGFRNRAHGFTQMFAKEAPEHWPREPGTYRNGSAWLNIGQHGPLRTYFGWQTYTTSRYQSGVEYRPMFSVKYRP